MAALAGFKAAQHAVLRGPSAQPPMPVGRKRVVECFFEHDRSLGTYCKRGTQDEWEDDGGDGFHADVVMAVGYCRTGMDWSAAAFALCVAAYSTRSRSSWRDMREVRGGMAEVELRCLTSDLSTSCCFTAPSSATSTWSAVVDSSRRTSRSAACTHECPPHRVHYPP